MEKIAIDLLPLEFRAEELKKAKFYKIQVIGVAIILTTIFLASLVIAFRILQSQKNQQIQKNLSKTEQNVSDLKNTQASLILLKNRLTTINQYLGTPSKQAQMYKLINQLLPPSVSVSSISVDKLGEVLVLATAASGDSVDSLVNNLISKEINQDKISKVSMETINRGKDGIYRLTFRVKPK